jgi:DUF971 family protein
MSVMPTPTNIKLLQKSRMLEIVFDDGKQFCLPCEYLRVFSPSAEVKGHGAGEGVLVTGKQNVNIIGIDPVGNYAVKLIFDDGHSSGLFSWETLYELGLHHSQNWQRYLERVKNASRPE